jgi:hypothetical protein
MEGTRRTGSHQALRTRVWVLHGLFSSEAALLELAHGRLALTTGKGRVFELPLSEVEVKDVSFPWYYFGGGAKLKIVDAQYRVSFVRPNDAADQVGSADGVIGASLELLTLGSKINDIGEGRAAARAWKAVLLDPASRALA